MTKIERYLIILVYYVFMISSLNVFFGTTFSVTNITILAIFFTFFEAIREYILKESTSFL